MLPRRSPSTAPGIIASPVYQPINAYAVGFVQSVSEGILRIGTDGSWLGFGTGYSPVGGQWYDLVTPGLGDGYELRLTTINVGGSGAVIENTAGDWRPLTAERQVKITASRYTSGSSTASYNIIIEIRAVGGTAVLSSGSLRMTVTAEVQANDGGGGPLPNCVATDMLLEPNLVAGDVQLGYRIECPDFDTESVVLLEVRNNTISPQPCWRIVTESGAAVVASDSTPMPLRGGGEAKLPEMLDREVLVADERGLTWERVIECRPVGVRDVVFINVGDNCYFAGEDAGKRIATHNATEQPK